MANLSATHLTFLHKAQRLVFSRRLRGLVTLHTLSTTLAAGLSPLYTIDVTLRLLRASGGRGRGGSSFLFILQAMTTATCLFRVKVGNIKQLHGHPNPLSSWKKTSADLPRLFHTSAISWDYNLKARAFPTKSNSNDYETEYKYYTTLSFRGIHKESKSIRIHEFSTEKEKSSKDIRANSFPSRDNVKSANSDAYMNLLPGSIKPYAKLARIDKPIGTMLLLWPCLWSTAIASSPTLLDQPDMAPLVIGDPKLIALFTAGSFIMRGAGCTINDMWDAKFDKAVERTATRPLASGELSYFEAGTFLGLQLTGGLAVLLSLPHLEYCFWLGASSLPLVVAYPLMKRYTNWPQLVLGMTFNWGALMGWAATHGELDWNALKVVLPLYAGGVAWTVVYDTLYAHQDKKDDAKLGLKSTALHFGERTKPILYSFATLASGSWMLSGINVGFTEPYYFLGCGLAGAHLFRQILTADLDDSKNLADRFKSNNQVGGLLFMSCVAGNFTV